MTTTIRDMPDSDLQADLCRAVTAGEIAHLLFQRPTAAAICGETIARRETMRDRFMPTLMFLAFAVLIGFTGGVIASERINESAAELAVEMVR